MDNKKNRWKNILSGVMFHLGMWVVGTGIFYFMSTVILQKMDITASWPAKLIFAVIAGFAWMIIGAYLTRKDEKVAEANRSIKSAVQKLLDSKPSKT